LIAQDEINEKPAEEKLPRLGLVQLALKQPVVIVEQNALRVYMSLRSRPSGRSRISVSITGGIRRQQPDPIETLKKEIEVEIDRAVKFSEPVLGQLRKKQIESLRLAAECDSKYFLREVKTTLESPVFINAHKQHDLGQVIMKASQDISALDKKYQTLFTSSTGLYQQVLTRLRKQVNPQIQAEAKTAVERFLVSAELGSGLEPQTVFRVRKWLELKTKHKSYDTVGEIANLVLSTFDDPNSDKISASQDTSLRVFCKGLLAEQKK
ncbi:MAG: hypothetical protein AAF394_08970, partial [Planctomycetota bacterium]